MAASYIPAPDAGFLDWVENFATLLTADPTLYGIDAIAAGIIQGAADAYSAAYALAVNPGTRTPVTVAAKDSARIVAQGTARTYAAQIRLNPGVANEDKIDLGLNLPNNAGSPIPAPSTFPLLTFLQASPGTHQFSFKDSGTPSVKAKPYGALQLELRAVAAVAAATDPELMLTKQMVTKSPFLVEWGAPDYGKIATYAGRWVTRRGLVSPWSALSDFLILGT